MSPWLSDLFLSSQSDARLVGLAREGRERAFAAIVERYRRELLVCARRLQSEGRAEDLVQQTFLNAFSALTAGVEVTHLRGWLYQILRNASIRAAQRGNAEAELEPSIIATEALEDTVERKILARDVLANVATLPERQRDALVATAIHGRSRAAVAASMGLSEGAVRQLMYRARAVLRTSVTAVTPWPLAKMLASTRTGFAGDRLSELVAGAGTASVGGVAAKVGAVVASGIVATGIVSTQLNHHHRFRRVDPALTGAHTTAVLRGGDAGTQAPTGPGFLASPVLATAETGRNRLGGPATASEEHAGPRANDRLGAHQSGATPGGSGETSGDRGATMASLSRRDGDGPSGGSNGGNSTTSTSTSGSHDGGSSGSGSGSSESSGTTVPSGPHDGGSGGDGSTTTPLLSPSGDGASGDASGSRGS